MTRFCILSRLWIQLLKVKLFGEKNEVAFSSLDVADQAQVMRLVRKGDLVLRIQGQG